MKLINAILLLIKLISFLLILLLLTLVGYLYWFNQNAKPIYFPYPYKFSEASKAVEVELNNPHVLLVGDIQGERFDPYFTLIKSGIEIETGYHLNFYNKAAAHTSLHRTLYYLKKLKKLPPIIIYFGGYEEFYENRLPLNQLNVVEYNYSKFQNSLYKNILYFLPQLAHHIYKNYTPVDLPSDTITERKEGFYDNVKQKEMILTYQTYEQELTELIELVYKQNKKLLIVTPPINSKLPPLKVCSNTTTEEIEREQNLIDEKIKKASFKETVLLINNLVELTPGNARSTYLRAQLFEQMNDPLNAQRYYELTTALDCSMKRPSIVFSQIAISLSKKYEVPLIDFNHELARRISE